MAHWHVGKIIMLLQKVIFKNSTNYEGEILSRKYIFIVL